VDIHKSNEDCEGNEMLYDEQLVAPTPDWRHGAEYDPNKYAPGSETFPGDVIVL
jgi:hypothetical protein